MLVNHIIIGAGRSGTTSLVAYLMQHDEINFSSIKEVTYFSIIDHYKRGTSFLHSFYEEDKGLKATSDTYLLMDRDAPKRIFNYNPNMKISVILRSPSERTYSNYNFSVNYGYIDKKIGLIGSEKLEKEILKNSDIVQQNNHCNFYGSLYHLHLTNWLKYFKREQLFICTTNQIKNNPQQLMDAYFDFLELDSIKIKKIQAQNQSVRVKNKILNTFLQNRNHPIRKLIRKPLQMPFLRKLIIKSDLVEKVKKNNTEKMKYPPMAIEEQLFCTSYFAEDLSHLKRDFGIKFD